MPNTKTGFCATDLDFVLFNWKTKRVMLIELKQHNAPIRYWQNQMFVDMARWMQKGVDRGWQILGYHSIVFEKTDFNDGECRFDGELITEVELIKKLNLEP